MYLLLLLLGVLAALGLLSFGAGYVLRHWSAFLLAPVALVVVTGVSMADGQWGELAPGNLFVRHMDEAMPVVLFAVLAGLLLAPVTWLGMSRRAQD